MELKELNSYKENITNGKNNEKSMSLKMRKRNQVLVYILLLMELPRRELQELSNLHYGGGKINREIKLAYI